MTVACPKNGGDINLIWDTYGSVDDRKTKLALDRCGGITTFRMTDNDDVNGEDDKNMGGNEGSMQCNNDEIYSVPTIRDIDVRLINLHVRRQLLR